MATKRARVFDDGDASPAKAGRETLEERMRARAAHIREIMADCGVLDEPETQGVGCTMGRDNFAGLVQRMICDPSPAVAAKIRYARVDLTSSPVRAACERALNASFPSPINVGGFNLFPLYGPTGILPLLETLESMFAKYKDETLRAEVFDAVVELGCRAGVVAETCASVPGRSAAKDRFIIPKRPYVIDTALDKLIGELKSGSERYPSGKFAASSTRDGVMHFKRHLEHGQEPTIRACVPDHGCDDELYFGLFGNRPDPVDDEYPEDAVRAKTATLEEYLVPAELAGLTAAVDTIRRIVDRNAV